MPFAFATGLISRFIRLSGQKSCFPHGLAGEDVIVIRCVDTLTAPAEKILCHVAVHGHRFGGGFRLAVAQDLMPDRTRYATLQVLKIDIAPGTPRKKTAAS